MLRVCGVQGSGFRVMVYGSGFRVFGGLGRRGSSGALDRFCMSGLGFSPCVAIGRVRCTPPPLPVHLKPPSRNTTALSATLNLKP